MSRTALTLRNASVPFTTEAFYEYLLIYPVTAIRESPVFTTWYKFADMYAAFDNARFADCDPDTEEIFGVAKFDGAKLFISTREGMVASNPALDYDLSANNYWVNVTDEALKTFMNFSSISFNWTLGHRNFSDILQHTVNTTHYLNYRSDVPAVSRAYVYLQNNVTGERAADYLCELIPVQQDGDLLGQSGCLIRENTPLNYSIAGSGDSAQNMGYNRMTFMAESSDGGMMNAAAIPAGQANTNLIEVEDLDVGIKDFAFLDLDLDGGEIAGNVYARIYKQRGSTYYTDSSSSQSM